MKPRDKGTPIDEVIGIFNRSGYKLTKPILVEWEKAFPMLQPIKHSDGKRFYTAENIDLISLIVDLILVKEHSYKYALSAIKNSKSMALQKRRTMAHLEAMKAELEDWRASLGPTSQS